MAAAVMPAAEESERRRVARRSLDEYLASPIDHFTGGEGWLHFCLANPWFAGTVFWGNLDANAFDLALRCATAARAAIPERHVALIDGRRARTLPPASFAMIADYIVEHRVALEERVARVAVVRSSGIVGAAVEGFLRIVPPPYPATSSTNQEDALRWLGCASHGATIEKIVRLASAAPKQSLVRELHETIAQDLLGVTIDDAAKRLGMSSRSLQRRLEAEGTSFHREVNALRLREAQRQMLASDRPLSCIAQQAGFASHAVFSTAFRRVLGVSPTQWREGELRSRESRPS